MSVEASDVVNELPGGGVVGGGGGTPLLAATSPILGNPHLRRVSGTAGTGLGLPLSIVSTPSIGHVALPAVGTRRPRAVTTDSGAGLLTGVTGANSPAAGSRGRSAREFVTGQSMSMSLEKPPTRIVRRKWNQVVGDWLALPWYITVIAVATLYAMFGDDARLATAPKTADPAFYALTCITLAVFVVDMVLNGIAFKVWARCRRRRRGGCESTALACCPVLCNPLVGAGVCCC